MSLQAFAANAIPGKLLRVWTWRMCSKPAQVMRILAV
jgi:hypothetical protein